MEKLTINIDPETWGNLITKYQAHSPIVKENDFTQGTINVDTDTNGSLTKRKGSVKYNQTLLAAASKDQYEAIFSDGARHLLVVANGVIKYSSGDTLFNSVVNGTGFSTGANFEFATTQDRVYGCNKVNAAIVYDRIAVYGGAAPVTVPQVKNMGCQIPSSAPTAGAPTAGGAVPDGAHTYKVTFVYYDSEESNGSAASGVQTAGAGNNTIPLTAIPIGGYGVTQRGIYRDNNDGNWVLLTYLTNNTATTYTDTLAIGVTPTPIPTNNGTPPIFGLISLWLDRLWLSQVPGDPYTLFYSEVAQPDIYGSENQILCNQEDPITATTVYFDRLIVFNRRSMGQILGNTPDTFRYAAIPSSVGCVDNRTLQTHVLHGVPVLLWLSERGFYTYDGNSIEYVSDWIEDLINYNIRQAIQQKNANAQSSFSSGTPSNGIDSSQLGSSITTRGYLNGTSVVGNNPKRILDDTLEWENGSQKANLALLHGDNQIKAVTRFTADLTQGAISGDMIRSGGLLKLATSIDHTGDSYLVGTMTPLRPMSSTSAKASAQKINIPRAGTINTITLKITSAGTTNYKYRFVIWADLAGSPGGALYTSVDYTKSIAGQETVNQVVNLVVTAGALWIGVESVSTSFTVYGTGDALSSHFGAAPKSKDGISSVWSPSYFTTVFVPAYNMAVAYTFTSSAIAANGTWESTVYDTYSDKLNLTYLTTNFTNLTAWGTKTINFTVRASTDGAVFTQIYSSPSLTGVTDQSVVLTGQRYLRFFLTMATTDNRETNTLNWSYLKFPNNVEWISDSIDTTSDVTVYNIFSSNQNTPSGTSITITIATSANQLGPWGGNGNGDGQFGPFGSTIVRQWVRIKAVLTKPVDDTITPSISTFTFSWTLVANFLSVIIDTGVAPPAGWDIFLAQYITNSGTVQFQMRSAATSGGIPAAMFYTITPAEFPSSSIIPLQFVQWKVIITSADNTVPLIDSVTVQWFISIVASVRPASIFVDGRYYIALAELNQNMNNLIIQLDLNGKWRRFAGLSINTFSFFFNRPYFGLSTEGQICKFLEGTTDSSNPIEFDVRTKAFDFSTNYRDVSEKQKIVGEIILHAKNTGALLQIMYSPDEGLNWYPFYTLNGATSYQTDTSNTDFFLRLKPSWTSGVPINGQHIMYRLYNNDVYQVQIHSIKTAVMLRKQPPVITG